MEEIKGKRCLHGPAHATLLSINFFVFQEREKESVRMCVNYSAWLFDLSPFYTYLLVFAHMRRRRNVLTLLLYFSFGYASCPALPEKGRYEKLLRESVAKSVAPCRVM